MNEDELYSMSDEELEALVREERVAGDLVDDEPEQEEIVEEEVQVEVEEDIEEEIEEDLEQPEADSDDDGIEEDEGEPDEDESEEDEGIEEDEGEPDEDESEEDEGEPDEELDSDEEPTDEEEEAKELEVQKPAQRTFKANGQEYSMTDEEILQRFPQVFGQAMDYTKKMQSIKPWRQAIDAWEGAELKQEDINLAIDVLKGDKDAIADVLKRTGVDALELDTDNSEYQPKSYGRNETELAIKDVIESISADKEYAVTYDVLEKQWDDKSRNAFVEDPEKIRLLHEDVKSGMYDQLAPIMNKLKVYDGGRKSDLDYYVDAAAQYFDSVEKEQMAKAQAEQAKAEQEKIEAVKAKQAKVKATKQASAKRKAAVPTKRMSGTKQKDYLDTDEDFEKWYNDLQERM